MFRCTSLFSIFTSNLRQFVQSTAYISLVNCRALVFRLVSVYFPKARFVNIQYISIVQAKYHNILWFHFYARAYDPNCLLCVPNISKLSCLTYCPKDGIPFRNFRLPKPWWNVVRIFQPCGKNSKFGFPEISKKFQIRGFSRKKSFWQIR